MTVKLLHGLFERTLYCELFVAPLVGASRVPAACHARRRLAGMFVCIRLR
jgi:hypothetical protein